MKKIIIFAGLLVSSLVSAQITATGNGDTIEDGDVFTFTELGGVNEEEAILNLVVTNNTEAAIKTRLRMESITNADGTEVQFCFGIQCHYDVTEGGVVPAGVSSVDLAPGESSNEDGHFLNNNSGINNTQPVEYVISVIQVDENGAIIGEPVVTFTYKYQPEMSLEDFTNLQNMGITVNNTLVKDLFNINSNVNAALQVYSLNGQLVKNADVKTGAQSFDLSVLNTGVYIARFTTEENKTSQIRIVKN